MGTRKQILYIMVFLFLIHLNTLEANAWKVDVSVNKVFMAYDQGYLGKIHLDLVETQGFYFEALQVGNYYRQTGTGLEFLALKRPQGELWFMLGRDEYQLQQTTNSLVRGGLRAKLPATWGKVILSADIMMDDITGVFIRYQLELNVPKGWLQGNVGCGNLLGSKDGYAFWVGFDL